MKTNLTSEQSQRLIELGVDPSKASEKTKVYEPIDVNHRWVSKVPIFDLSDVLALLPKEATLNGITDNLTIIIEPKRVLAGYPFYHSDEAMFYAPELIDALFELLVWCITNKHVEL